MYNPALAPVLDWLAVFGYLAIALIVTWRVINTTKSD